MTRLCEMYMSPAKDDYWSGSQTTFRRFAVRPVLILHRETYRGSNVLPKDYVKPLVTLPQYTQCA